VNLLHLAAKLSYLASTLQDTSNLLQSGAVDSLGKRIVKTVQDTHGDVGKLRSLEPSTQQSRSEQGYTPNEPLLRDGSLRNSYTHEVMKNPDGDGPALVIGSPEDIALWQELGFYNKPAGVYVSPRPVLMPSVFAHEEDIKATFGQALVSLWGEGLSSALPGNKNGLDSSTYIG
jgi:hypothetical protein